MKPLIEARGLSFSFGNRKVLDGINFEAKKGEAVFLLGPNGSGKTTLLKLLLGFYRSLKGEVLIKGRLLQKPPVKTLPGPSPTSRSCTALRSATGFWMSSSWGVRHINHSLPHTLSATMTWPLSVLSAYPFSTSKISPIQGSAVGNASLR